jgi:PBP1b-binding outer membrane lipoprotein LpoB
MSRCVGFGLALIATLLISGCNDTKPDAPQASPPISADTSAVDSADAEAPAAVPAEGSAPGDPSVAEAPAEETKPTVLGAIGKAVAGALGASDDGPSEAPAYEPPE